MFQANEAIKLILGLGEPLNGREVWRTRDYPVLSNKFAFWVADTTDAVMSSYVVRQ